MAITNASRVADFGSGIGTEGAVLQVDNTNKRIGIGTTNPQAMLQVGTAVTVYGNSGIVSATKFYGDGSNITNAGSTLAAGSGAQRVVVTSLTTGTMTSAASHADLSWNSSTSTLGVTSVSATNLTGALIGNVTGDASGSSGSCTGNAATATLATNASGLSGSPNITINNLVGVAATFSGVVTYEDVTNVDSLGIITARSYVSIADSIVHTGDTDTSLRFPSADTITAETAGSERLRIDSSGRVGIGTDAPDMALHVLSSSDDVARLQSTSATNGPALTLDHIGDSPADDDIIGKIVFNGRDDGANSTTYADIRVISSDVSNGSEDGDITFGTRAAGTYAERLRITSAGNVGIGTDSPSTKLHLIGQVGGSNPSAGSKWDIARFVSHNYVPTNSGGLTIGAYWNIVLSMVEEHIFSLHKT